MTNTITINGTSVDVPAGAVAYKYADPTEDARWIYNRGEAEDIAREDSGLIVWAKIAVLDDCTRDADVIGYAADEDEAADAFMAYMKDRMSADDFDALARPAFAYRSETGVVSPAYEPLF